MKSRLASAALELYLPASATDSNRIYLIMAKSLGGGLPLGAVTGRAEIMDAPGPGGLGGTFAGNPLACAAALAVLDMFEKTDLLRRANEIGTEISNPRQAMAEAVAV